MSKAVVETKAAGLPSAMTATAWGDDVHVGGQDIIIPKCLLMQGLSDLVTDGKAVMGEFRDSLSGAKLADAGGEFEFIPFYVEKFWDIHAADGGAWLRTEALVENPSQAGYNDNLKWEGKDDDGESIKRVRRMNFYGVLATDVAKGEAVPYILSFKSMSFKEGKKLFTQMYVRNKRANLPPCGYVVKVKSVRRENDKGKFYIPVIELGSRATEKQAEEAFNWFKMIKNAGSEGRKVVADESDVTKNASSVDIDDTGEF